MPSHESATPAAEERSDDRSPAPQADGVAGVAATGAGSNRKALSVTRLAHFSLSKPAPIYGEFLGCGVDSLDLGIYVNWGAGWESFGECLEERKQAAAGTQGIALAPDTEYLMMPSGKPPQYRWHLKHPDFDLFLGRSTVPYGPTPNAYVSLSSRLLWSRGLPAATAYLRQHLEALGGTILDLKPSRCDLAADFHIPGGLTFDFLREHRVPINRQISVNMLGDELETYYFGSKKSPIQLRIYDKGKEILSSCKEWFLDVWERETGEDVWRVEYQLRRPVLKEFQINAVDDLPAKLCGMWEHLTTDWFSLRLPDNENTTRRSLHPWWASVSRLGEKFGERNPVQRLRRGSDAKERWLVNHIGGCVKTLAALREKGTLDEAVGDLGELLRAKYHPDTFAEDVRVRKIRRGISVSPEKDFNDEEQEEANPRES
ncbi:MAG: hypothetical protein R3C01_17130 [Planctomycetaceae bacterium]